MDKLQDKVKLPKEVAAQLDWINQHHDYPVRVVVDLFNGQANGDLTVLSEYFESDRSRRITLITQALYIGYEVEQSPEDKVREFFDKMQEIRNLDQVNAVLTVLRILNISIKGVNAE